MVIARWLTYIFLVSVFLVLQGCLIPKTIRESEEIAVSLQEEGKLNSYQLIENHFSLHYVSLERAGQDKDKNVALVFIHGTPGDWKIFGSQLANTRLSQAAQLIALDRPGWGGSVTQSKHAETSLAKQAELIAPLLLKLKENGQKILIAGHSLGATLAPRIAMSFPELVDGAVVIAGDLSEEYFDEGWYNKIGSWDLIHAVLPKTLCYANDEVIGLRYNLQLMHDLWGNLSVPIWVIQGGKDSLVDPRNAEFATNLQTQSSVYVKYFPEAGHLIHLTHKDQVEKILIEAIEVLNSGTSPIPE